MNSIYQIIGFIDNYTGGFSSQDNLLQRIYSDENRSGKIEIFKNLCLEFFKESAITKDIEIVNNIFYSEAICKKIKNICDDDKFLGRDYFLLSEDIFTEQKNVFNPGKSQQRVAFLKGVLLQHQFQNESKIHIYNDYNKASLAHRIMCSLASDEDEIIWKSHFLIPHTDTINISKEGNLWKLLNQ